MKKLIVIEQGNKYQYDSIEELVKDLIDENYYSMNQEQRAEIINKKARLNMLNKIGSTESDKIITINEYTYILSLASLDIITILERKDADIFLKELNKENFEGNYKIINRFAKQLLMKYA